MPIGVRWAPTRCRHASSTPDAFTRLCPLGPLLPSRHVEAGFTCAWYKSNSWLVFTTQIFFWYYTAHLIHLSQWHPRPFLLTMSSHGPTRTVVKAYYLTPGAYFIDSRLSSSLSDTPKWLTVCFFFRIRLLLHQMGTPSPPCFALFVLIERIESQSLNGLRTAV